MSREDTQERCRRCAYGAPVYIGDGDEVMLCCTYVLRKGRTRRCPPGEGCTVFEPKEKGEMR